MRLIYFILPVIFFSCATAKQYAKKFPVTESTKEVIRIDTIKGQTEFIEVPCPDGSVVKIETLPPVTILETKTITKTIESMAKLKAFETEVKKRERVEKHRYDKMVNDFNIIADQYRELKTKKSDEFEKLEKDLLEKQIKLNSSRLLVFALIAGLVVTFLPKIISFFKIFL